MKYPNVVLIVVDTLREDYSDGLDKLSTYGFVRYSNVLAQTSWTLPSHVSMMTGELPSQHGVHENLGTSWTDLMRISRNYLLGSERNILRKLKIVGYKTYGASTNPFISPQFGFLFDNYREFSHFGDVSESHDLWWLINFGGANPIQTISFLLKRHSVKFLPKMVYLRIFKEMMTILGAQHMEKGSKFVVNRMRKTQLDEPFFYFVNIMEPHEPYVWGEDSSNVVPSAILGRPEWANWKDSYPQHARLAASRALEVVSAIVKYDPLIIVTSDHGQLLGEQNRFGHGYFLDDALQRVPLYVRLPGGGGGLERKGEFISLTEIPAIIEAVVSGRQRSFGNDFALAESFGCQPDVSEFIAKEDEAKLEDIFSRRVRVFSRSGSAVINQRTKLVETSSVGLSREEIAEMEGLIPPESSPLSNDKGLKSTNDERLVLQRLRDLGYE